MSKPDAKDNDRLLKHVFALRQMSMNEAFESQELMVIVNQPRVKSKIDALPVSSWWSDRLGKMGDATPAMIQGIAWMVVHDIILQTSKNASLKCFMGRIVRGLERRVGEWLCFGRYPLWDLPEDARKYVGCVSRAEEAGVPILDETIAQHEGTTVERIRLMRQAYYATTEFSPLWDDAASYLPAEPANL